MCSEWLSNSIMCTFMALSFSPMCIQIQYQASVTLAVQENVGQKLFCLTFFVKRPFLCIPGVNVVKKNSIRLAEVWMDEYKHYYYERFNNDLVGTK